MPEPSIPNPTSPSNHGSRPLCPGCGKPFGLDRIEPHPRYFNAMVRIFSCDCGEATADIFTLEL
jgi:hypothetical protein